MTDHRDSNRMLVWALLGVVALAIVTSLLGGMMGWGGWGWGMMGFMWIWMLVPVLLVAWLISVLVHQDRPAPQHEDALAVAERRYATGQITREESERIREDLGDRP